MVIEWTLELVAYLIVSSLITIGFLAVSKPFGAFVNLVVTVLVMTWLFHVDFLPLVQNPAAFIGWALAYFAVGGLYSVLRWWFHVRALARKIVEETKEVPPEFPGPEEVERFYRRISDNRYYHLKRMEASNNVGRLTGWISFWPFDLVVLVVQDPAQRLFQWLGSTYHRLAVGALSANNLDENGKPLSKLGQED